jgi:hypothetical protein
MDGSPPQKSDERPASKSSHNNDASTNAPSENSKSSTAKANVFDLLGDE